MPEGSEDEEEGDDGYEAVNVDELGGYAQDMTDKEADAEDDDWLTEFWQLMEEVSIYKKRSLYIKLFCNSNCCAE